MALMRMAFLCRQCMPACLHRLATRTLAAASICPEAIKSIERRMKETKAKIEAIENIVGKANLSSREREYVRLRYFFDLSALAVAQRMFVSDATGGRTRCAALGKIKVVMEKKPQ